LRLEESEMWSAPSERSGDGALDSSARDRRSKSGVALRLPPYSKINFSAAASAAKDCPYIYTRKSLFI
jgi:hypothetical protein